MNKKLALFYLFTALFSIMIFGSCKKEKIASESTQVTKNLSDDPSLKLLSILKDPIYMLDVVNTIGETKQPDYSFYNKVIAEQKKIVAELTLKYNLINNAEDSISHSINVYRQELIKNGLKDEWRLGLLPKRPINTSIQVKSLSLSDKQSTLKSSFSDDLDEVVIEGVDWRYEEKLFDDGLYQIHACEASKWSAKLAFYDFKQSIIRYSMTSDNIAATRFRLMIENEVLQRLVLEIVKSTCSSSTPTDPGIPGGGTGGSPVTNPTSNYYSEAEMSEMIDNLEDPITGDGIELYLIAKYKGSKLIDLTQYSTSNGIIAGEYTLIPHYGKNGQLLFYAGSRSGLNGIEYIVRPNQLDAFRTRINHYTNAANLVYMNGIPSQAMIKSMSGDRVSGLLNLWIDAVQSPDYWAYVISCFAIKPSDQAIRKAVRDMPVKVGHTTMWENMTTAERSAFQHSYSRHGAELNLPNWSQTNAEALRIAFNEKVSMIRALGAKKFFHSQEWLNGAMTTVNRTEVVINGERYFYYETLDGKFISVGKMP